MIEHERGCAEGHVVGRERGGTDREPLGDAGHGAGDDRFGGCRTEHLAGDGGIGQVDAATLGHEHVRHTVQMLQGYSVSLAEAVAEGRCAIVGLEYTLADGQVQLTESVGDIG